MSHRRKNAHPTSKLRRNAVPDSPCHLGASGSDAGSAATTPKVTTPPPQDLSASAEPPSGGPPAPHLSQIQALVMTHPERTPTATVTPATPHPDPQSPSSVVVGVTPQLALPPDLWEDFQALQAATHLDTASLIRRLIHQYGRTGSQSEDRPSSATDTDTTICADDHVQTSSPCGGSSGETTYYGEQAACPGGDIGMLPASSEYPVHHDLTADDEEDCLILDLSSGVRDAQHPSSTAPAPSDLRVGYPEEADVDPETPLDLTVSKSRELLHSGTSEGLMMLGKAPEAHRSPSNSILFSALSHGLGHSSAASAPSVHPREAHSALSGGLTPSPRPVSSSLFNLSELPLACGQRVSSAAQTEQRQNKLSVSSGARWSEEIHTKQKIVQHFLSLPTGHVQVSELQQALGTHEKQGSAVKMTPTSSEALRHLSLPSAVPHTTPSSSSSLSVQKCVDHSKPLSAAAPSSTPMRLPTLTSLEFQGSGSVGKSAVRVQEDATLSHSAVAVTLSSLPTSASAILLDVGSGGLVAGAGGGLTGVSTLNIPLMATGAGGLVAIPLLHTLPEALATAAAAATSQGQQPASSAPSSTSSTIQPPPPSRSLNELPPPPPYSAAVAAASNDQPKKYKAKMGRPRGQPKVQKSVPKDMKLLTENTLFPGVYTSILKLPWSKRSRGKSSVKIKDVIGKSTTTASACLPDQQADPQCGAPGQIPTTLPQQQRPQAERSHSNSTASSDTAALSILPVLVPDQASSTSTALPTSSSSSSSVMMVYHNSVMSEMGKPVRKRGRPPKLPVLSQLLTENTSYCDRLQDEDQLTAMDVGSFSLIPLSAHPAFDASAVAFPTNAVDAAAAAGFASSLSQEQLAGIKQEPMEVTETQVNKLFPLLHAVPEKKEDSAYPRHDLHSHQFLKQETDETAVAVTSADVRETTHGDVTYTEMKAAEGRDADLHDPSLRHADVKDADRGGHYGCQETGETGSTDRGDAGGGGGGADSFQDPNLETRFHMLANQLGLEIGSPYHTSLVYGQSPTAAAKNFLYQPVMLPSQAMVEMKPRRRQLNNLIKPSDDCVYTSFRIRPRNSGRRGGKRGGKRRGTGTRYSTSKLPHEDDAVAESVPAKEPSYQEGGGGDRGRSGSGSAVITEMIPGAGEVPQRLYQDLYHCKVCNELLPVDNCQPHTCAIPASPPLCSCEACGTMFLSNPSVPETPVMTRLCEDCTRKTQQHAVPVSAEGGSQDQTFSEGFACQPCGVHFVNISDYIQHRRSAHLEKMSRQTRKTHTLKTLPCPTRGCPRLFHMHAELSRHLRNDHSQDLDHTGMGGEEGGGGGGGGDGGGGGGDTPPTAPSPSNTDSCQDVDVVTVPTDKEMEISEEDHAQFTCSQGSCGQRFATALHLLEHVQACHEDVSQWPCPLPGCSRQFGSERHLRVHLLMHKEEKPLKCPFCHYRCRQKNALHWHMRKHPESAASQYRKFAGMTADS